MSAKVEVRKELKFEEHDSEQGTLVGYVNGEYVCSGEDEGYFKLTVGKSIARAVNSHDELLESCKIAIAQYQAFVVQNKLRNDPYHKRTIERIETTIAKAEGGTK